MGDDGRESEDVKEHTPTQELADTMAATHIIDVTRSVGKSYRAATMEGAAWSTIGPKGKSVRMETIGSARQGGGNRGEGRSGYARGEGRGGLAEGGLAEAIQQGQADTAEGRANGRMETDAKRKLAQLQAEVAALVIQKQQLQQDEHKAQTDTQKDSEEIHIDDSGKEGYGGKNVTVNDVTAIRGEDDEGEEWRFNMTQAIADTLRQYAHKAVHNTENVDTVVYADDVTDVCKERSDDGMVNVAADADDRPPEGEVGEGVRQQEGEGRPGKRARGAEGSNTELDHIGQQTTGGGQSSRLKQPEEGQYGLEDCQCHRLMKMTGAQFELELSKQT
eukprot:gene13670-29067_t